MSGTNQVQIDFPKGGLARIDIVASTVSFGKCAEFKFLLTPEELKLIAKKQKKQKKQQQRKKKDMKDKPKEKKEKAKEKREKKEKPKEKKEKEDKDKKK